MIISVSTTNDDNSAILFGVNPQPEETVGDVWKNVLQKLALVQPDITGKDFVNIRRYKRNDKCITLIFHNYATKMSLLRRREDLAVKGLSLFHYQSSQIRNEYSKIKNLSYVKRFHFKDPTEMFSVSLCDGRFYNKVRDADHLAELRREQLANNLVLQGISQELPPLGVIDILNSLSILQTLRLSDFVSIYRYNDGSDKIVLEFREQETKYMFYNEDVQKTLVNMGLSITDYVIDAVMTAIQNDDLVDSVVLNDDKKFTIFLKSGQCLENVSSYRVLLDLISDL